MAISQISGRQYPLIAKIPFSFDDFESSGVAERALGLPGNATVIGGELVIETAFNSGTSDALDVGDGDDVDRYAAGVDAQTVARTALTLTGYKYTTPDSIDIIWTGVGAAPTAGAGYLLVEYVLDDRAHEAQPEPI